MKANAKGIPQKKEHAPGHAMVPLGMEPPFRVGRLLLAMLLVMATPAWGRVFYVSRCALPYGDGSIDAPYDSLGKAVQEAAPGDIIRVAAGAYPNPGLLDRPVTLEAHGGPASIGMPVPPCPPDPSLPEPGQIPAPRLPVFQHLALFQAEFDFAREVGKVDGGEAVCLWQDHPAGYVLAHLEFNGGRGIELPGGIFRWTVRLRRGSEPVQFSGSPVFRFSVWDVTTGEMLVQRALHAGEFAAADVYETKSLIHSTAGREHHRFEPRLLWESFVDGFVDSVSLEAISGCSTQDLESKALELDQTVQRIFLDPLPFGGGRGLLVAQPSPGTVSDSVSHERGDSATWTSYYVAAEAFRLMARPGDTEALENMERGFRALHALHEVTGQPGVIARYADSQGRWRYQDPSDGRWHAGRHLGTTLEGRPIFEQWANAVISEDISTSFAFAIGAGYHLIRDPVLKDAIRSDMRALARHLLDRDLGIETEGRRVDLNPYLSPQALDGYIEEFISSDEVESALENYREFRNLRSQYNSLASLSEIAQLLSFGCLDAFNRIPDPFLTQEDALAAALEQHDAAALRALLPSVVPELYRRIFWIRDFLRAQLRSVREGFDCIGRLPNTNPGERYSKLLAFAERVLGAMDAQLERLPTSIQDITGVKFHASHAIEVAHILSVARMVAPEEFTEPYYQTLLGPEKNLLNVMDTWAGTGEEWVTLISGDLAADKQRRKVAHRSFAALFTLIRIEPRAEIQAVYRRVFEKSWQPFADERNAFYDVIREATGSAPVGGLPTDLGAIGWSLGQLPMVNTVPSLEIWQQFAADIGAAGGGWLHYNAAEGKGTLRDPAPVNFRSGEMFLWQRNPRKIGFDAERHHRLHPSIDFLLPYWMARAAGIRPTSPSNPSNSWPRILPGAYLNSSGEIGLSIGRGTSFSRTCKDRAGFFAADSEASPLPVPYGPVNVPREGLRIGNAQIRIVRAENDWSLTINPQPDGIHWNVQVCRAGGIEKPGSEITFVIDPFRPATLVSPVPPPQISITRTRDRVVLNWSAGESDYTLESSEELGITASWQSVSAPQVNSNGIISVELDMSEAAAFFRMRISNQPNE